MPSFRRPGHICSLIILQHVQVIKVAEHTLFVVTVNTLSVMAKDVLQLAVLLVSHCIF